MAAQGGWADQKKEEHAAAAAATTRRWAWIREEGHGRGQRPQL